MSKRTKIGVVTSTRADYGIFRPLLFKLRDADQFQLDLYVTGMHLSKAFGETVHNIIEDGFTPTYRIEILNEQENIAQETADTIAKFSAIFAQDAPNLLVVLGDRYEIFAVATAATFHKIPVAHIHGGEVTDGALDNVFRHSITKMSYLHFSSTESYRNRIIQLGEHPDRVFNVGAMGVENCLNLPLLSKSELSSSIGVALDNYIVVVFHPETMSAISPLKQYQDVLQAIKPFEHMQFIFIFSNSDPGGQLINQEIELHCANAPESYWFKSLSSLQYLSLIKHSRLLLGNSSSGIIEAPSLHTPTLNIGNRQKGRVAADSVVHVSNDSQHIQAAVEQILSHEMEASAFASPYGQGNSSERIFEILQQYPFESIQIAKSFYDLEH